MFVSSRSRVVKHPSVLVEGHLYHVDSGMGGSFTVKYVGHQDGSFVFLRLAHDDFPEQRYEYSGDELEKVYILAPENFYDEITWDAEQARKLRYSRMYDAYWGWYPPEPDRISYGYLQANGLLPNHWKVGDRVYWYRDGFKDGLVTEVTKKGLLVGDLLISYGGAFRSSSDVSLRMNAS